MRHITSFVGPSVGLTAPYRYSVDELDTLGRVRLSFKAPGQPWEFGHSKDIPLDWTAEQVAETMRRFILGEIDPDEYNQILQEG